MTFNYALLLSHVVCLVVGTIARKSIINGVKAGEHQFPYQVSLVLKGKGNVCGGGIIGDKFILTAAHCVIRRDDEIDDRPLFIAAGTNDWKKAPVFVQVQKIYVTKGFHVKHSRVADVAILKLKDPLDMIRHQLQHLKLPKPHETFTGEIAKIAGWGWNSIKIQGIKEVGIATDSYLRFVDSTVIPINQCQHTHLHMKILETHLCARVKQNNVLHPRGVCVGDSGSPLVLRDGKTVIGILSRSPQGCNEEERPALYTSVSHYLNFINDAINDKPSHDIDTFEFNI